MTFCSSSMSASSFPSHIPNPTKNTHPFLSVNATPSNGRTKMGNRIEHEGLKKNPKPSKPISNSGPGIKAPTPPWMKEPLLVKPNEILKFRKPRTHKDSTFHHPDLDLTGKVGGGRGKVAMKQIFKSIEKLKEAHNSEENNKSPENSKFKFAPGDLWGDGDCEKATEAEDVKESLDMGAFDVSLREVEREEKVKMMPWVRNERMVVGRIRKEKAVTAAELSLDGVLLERLRGEAGKMREWVKVKKAGVTQAVVDQVHFAWRRNELALLKFDLPLCRNMDRAREIVELKTGGLVVWSNKDFLAVYRGCNYRSRSKLYHRKSSGDQQSSSFNLNEQNTLTVGPDGSDGSGLEEMPQGENGEWDNLRISLYEREADRLLDGLGPRFVDWWMQKPLPVDADLLPEVIPGFMPPRRLCPPRTRSQLTDAELTYLRKLARPLPTHFVLGRNRKLQGLAAAILKLWEKCHIAKIALKWGIPNTDNEQMAYELKILTGGILILRNKFLIILYRGKDFLPSAVANLVAHRQTKLTICQLEEEAARLKASESISITSEQLLVSDSVGTLSEFNSFQSESRNVKEENSEVEVGLEAEKKRLEKELRDQERKLFILEKKIEKSAKILEKLNDASKFSDQDADREIISQEERECLKEMGLRMESSLVLGRRGIFDGVIEGIYQHWKHREVVKVITMQKKFSQVMYTSKSLEAETGGVLVSIVELKEGHAIIVYRGKNYKRPKAAQNLLNKREALSRSLEIQRFGSMKFFARQREQEIHELKLKLAEFSEKGIDILSE